MYRKPVREASPSTQLVQQLYSFGIDSNADASTSSPSLPGSQAEASTSALAPPITELGDLSLGEPAARKQKRDKITIAKLLRSTEHTVLGEGDAPARVLTSWKMADYAYKRDPCPFPTRARGLFTERVAPDEYRIVARGYDKFFNVNEVSWTQWEKIPEYSTGPYELTTKSNGCIILIAALSPTELVVTSKHGIGKNENALTERSVSHPERGEHWLEQHVARVGKTKQDLARELFERNLTAVAELCDDSFEEHVLAYPTEQTGLHLHGLNHNSPILNTLPSSEVTAFAKRYGMIQTAYFTFPSVVAVKTYCETVEQVGGVEFVPGSGKITPVEGFVVRGKKRGGEPGEAFFWKVKYDEPYLMYREWREITKKCLAVYPEMDKVDPMRIKNPDTRLYVWWVKREIEHDHAKFDSWKYGKGIIKTREEFLAWEKTMAGLEARRELGEVVELNEEEKKNRKFDKTIVVPIAIQGCGKTALGLELKQLFGFGHVQSDDFLVKKPQPHFLRRIKELLETHDVVYADKNNHQAQHRSDIVHLANSLASKYRIRLVALVYPVDSAALPRDQFHALMARRIVSRGENHQSLRAGEVHEAVIWQFLGQHEAFDPVANAQSDGKFDVMIEMRPEWERMEALDHVARQLANIDGMNITVPEPTKLEEAIEFAKAWKVEVKKSTPDDSTTAVKKRQQKVQKPRYYGLAVEVNLRDLLPARLPVEMVEQEDSLWNSLVKASRVETKPHVTLVHQVELKLEDEAIRVKKQDLWDRYEAMVELATREGSEPENRQALEVEVVLGPRLVWNDRVMSIEVSELVSTSDQIGFAEDRSAHITVGTRSSDIRPIEGKWIMEQALSTNAVVEDTSFREIRIDVVKVKARLAGLS
ncbi:tRNA ligase [Sporobolomyces koalae]|uniref:tRNA ligase n=1 Tax=Sporobolomyces koalae TaxID=500713 RepID=UPI00317B06E8